MRKQKPRMFWHPKNWPTASCIRHRSCSPRVDIPQEKKTRMKLKTNVYYTVCQLATAKKHANKETHSSTLEGHEILKHGICVQTNCDTLK